MAAGTAYAKRYTGGFKDKPDLTTPIDQQFLNAVEAALLQLIGSAPNADGQVMQWDNANTRFGPALLLNKNIDPAASIDKSKLGPLNIVDSDVSGAAAIAPSKIANPGDPSKFFRGDGTFAVPAAQSTVAVATTVAGLAPTASGKVGRLRLGTTPFEFVDVVYDTTYGKWISPAIKIANANGTMTAANTDFWNLGGGHVAWKKYLTAGLSPQFYVMGRTKVAAAAVNDAIGFAVGHISHSSYPSPLVHDYVQLMTMTEQRADTSTGVFGGWSDYDYGTFTLAVPGSPKDLMVVSPWASATFGGNIDVDLSCWMRWIG